MSKTATVSSANTQKTTRPSSLLLSPSKRRRLAAIEAATRAYSTPQPTACRITEKSPSETTSQPAVSPKAPSTVPDAPSAPEIWKWTLSKDAVAPCFAKDVMDMKDSGAKDAEFFWLGRVPCRSVHLVGLLVGVQVYESRTIYSLDDGTAVIDCVYKHPPPPAPTATVRKLNPKMPMSVRPQLGSSSPYKLPAASTSKSTFNALPTAPPPLPKYVGALVSITGRVVNRGEGRLVLVDEIKRCSSPNDEPNHWLAVTHLHQTSYFAPDMGPFLIPKVAVRSLVMPASKPASSAKGKEKASDKSAEELQGQVDATPGMAAPQTPTSSRAPSVVGSPELKAVGSEPQSPPRLRHPSRLHTRDLTANTFRIYLKHYMDHAPPLHARARPRSASPSPPSSNHRAGMIGSASGSTFLLQESQTKPSASARAREEYVRTWASVEKTPHPAQARRQPTAETERTPRASKKRSAIHSVIHTDTDHDDEDDVSRTTHGFTLSYLRRVPELALLARRVVDAEARRRAREERRHAAHTQTQSQDKHIRKLQGSTAESKALKVKRLFRFAIRQLYDEGSIVLWDGPTRPLSSAAISTQDSDHLWKAHPNSSTTAGSVTHDTLAFDDEEELSDPPPDEEAYLPLTPAYLAGVVAHAITEIMARAAAKASMSKRPRRTDDLSTPLQPPMPPPGPTPAEILTFLRRDTRWARVGEWAVKDALEWGRREGTMWCVGHGRWELCG